ncbi:MAG TPA: nucleotidyltransferase family protein [Mucilaginibacter sp.]
MITLNEIADIYSNEQLFLLLISRVYFSISSADELNDFIATHDIDWKSVKKIARTHSIRPFVYHVIEQHKLNVPINFKSSLKDDSQLALKKNMIEAVVAAKITKDLKELGVSVISYKGPLLTSQYYENMAMRESVDIDFIGDQNDVGKIEDYFISCGYLAKETVPRSYLKLYLPFFRDIAYRIPAYNFCVEIHWALLNRFAGRYPSYAFFKQHTMPYHTKYGDFTILSPAYDFLAIVSNHFVKDMGTKFKCHIDIACILSKYPDLLNDPVILDTAKEYGFEKKLKKGLSAVKDLIGINIPDSYQWQLTREDLGVPLACPIGIRKFQFDNPAYMKRSLALQDNFKNKFRLLTTCFLYIFIPSHIDINTFRLPAIFYPVLFIFRPFRLLFERIRPTHKKQ